MKGIQDYYPDHFAHCYGCGRLNKQGLQLKTNWDGDETLSLYTPQAHHTAIEGFVYGGLLASLIDCHGTGSASLAFARKDGIDVSEHNAPRCVTASLKVDYLKPTPIDGTITVTGTIKELKGRKAIIEAFLSVNGELCVKGEVIAIRINDDFGKK
jgi:acyl-coenzyme A thioesterase PaaI-like protein